jgi:hypothetical protein
MKLQRIDWRAAHFGCPDGVRFYTSGTSIRYLRVFRANPERQADGQWTNVDDVLDVSLGVPEHAKDDILRAIQADLKVEADLDWGQRSGCEHVQYNRVSKTV